MTSNRPETEPLPAPRVRPARPDEAAAVVALAVRTVLATYRDLSPGLTRALESDGAAIVGDAAYWAGAWVGTLDDAPAGVLLTKAHRLEDLWIDPPHQGRGLGRALLVEGERQIAAGGHAFAELNVVRSNHRAIRFYEAHGWSHARDYLHERWGFEMTLPRKRLGGAGGRNPQ